MSDFDEAVRKLCAMYPPLEEYSDEITDILEQFRKRNEDMRFRIAWLENFQIRLLNLVSTLLSEDQKRQTNILDLLLMINKHLKRFNPEFFKEILMTRKKISEEALITRIYHPEEEIERLRKIFDLEDLPKILTYDFIKTHYGDEQLEIYKQILEEDEP